MLAYSGCSGKEVVKWLFVCFASLVGTGTVDRMLGTSDC